MGLPQALHNLGAILVLAVGLLAVTRPEFVARFMALEILSPFGRSELRGGTGGVFCGLAGFALWSQDALAFAAIGAAFIGITLTRWIEVALGNREPRIWAAIVLDAGLAGLLLYPQAL